MLLKIKSPLTLEGRGRKMNSRFNSKSKPSMSSEGNGLRILIEIPKWDSNVLVKSSLKHKYSTPTHSCFLQFCHLCNKKLKPDEDVYMYRGDQGFCSVECRDRQIFMDEMSELESSTKSIRSCFPRCGASRRSETSALVEDLRRRRNLMQ